MKIFTTTVILKSHNIQSTQIHNVFPQKLLCSIERLLYSFKVMPLNIGYIVTKGYEFTKRSRGRIDLFCGLASTKYCSFTSDVIVVKTSVSWKEIIF